MFGPTTYLGVRSLTWVKRRLAGRVLVRWEAERDFAWEFPPFERRQNLAFGKGDASLVGGGTVVGGEPMVGGGSMTEYRYKMLHATRGKRLP